MPAPGASSGARELAMLAGCRAQCVSLLGLYSVALVVWWKKAIAGERRSMSQCGRVAWIAALAGWIGIAELGGQMAAGEAHALSSMQRRYMAVGDT